MKSNTRFRAGCESHNRGEAGKEFQVNNPIDADSSNSMHCSQRTQREAERTARRERYHISLGNDAHCIENEAIVFEYNEVNVFASDYVDRPTNCRISENGRALLGELDEENAPNLTRPGWRRGLKDLS